MRRFLVVAAAVSLALWSCGEDHHGDQGSDVDGQTTSSVPGLRTDGDKKWQMDDHTEAMFAAMSRRVEATDADIKALGKALQGDLDKLVQGCTMTGKTHDALHRYLIVYMPAVKRLSKSGSGPHLTRVRELLRAYPDYFE